MKILLISYLAAGAVTLGLTPLFIRLISRWGIMSRSSYRTIHKNPRPLLGGLVIFLVFSGIAGLTAWLSPHSLLPFKKWLITIFLGSLPVLLVGIFDDWRGISYPYKLLLQLAGAVIVITGGFQINSLLLPGDRLLALAHWRVPITIFWLLLITNAFNLIDGIDGLAGGIAITALFIFLGIFLWYQTPALALPIVWMLGILSGFLVFNFYPARIFLGDSGSLLIGFWIGALTLNTPFQTPKGFQIIPLMLILGIPLLDTGLAFFRRILARKNPFNADKRHLHHLLLQQGWNQRAIFTWLCSLNLCWGLFTVIHFIHPQRLPLFALLLLATTAGFIVWIFSSRILKPRKAAK